MIIGTTARISIVFLTFVVFAVGLVFYLRRERDSAVDPTSKRLRGGRLVPRWWWHSCLAVLIVGAIAMSSVTASRGWWWLVGGNLVVAGAFGLLLYCGPTSTPRAN